MSNAGTGFVTVFVTAPSREEVEHIARVVVKRRLAACANVMPPVTSFYRWEGRVHEEREWAVLLKTSEDAYPALEKAIALLHTYEVPCITAWPVGAGYAPYLEWLGAETSTPST